MYKISIFYDIIKTINLRRWCNVKKNVRITTISNNHEVRYDTKAIVTEKAITYIEKDGKKTKTYFNYEKNQLIRENKEILMKYNFDKAKETTGQLLVYDVEKSVLLKIKTKELIRENENISIKFLVENEPIEYKIEVIK